MRWQTLMEGRWIFAAILLAAAITWWFAPRAAWLWVAPLAFTLYFFRDPERQIPHAPGLLVAPADGVVRDIGEVEEDEFTGERMRRIGIFLSVFDVHVNRMPAAGIIAGVKETPGQFFDARHPEASTRNQRRSWLIESERGPLVVRQITGAIARRIVGWAKKGDRLEKGDRFGMIRFGSRTELYVPLDAWVLVKIGDPVVGGHTVVARWK